MNRCAIVGLVGLVLLGGCGGNDHETTRAASRQAGEAPRGDSGGEEDKSGLDSIAAADRRAFVQIGIATSDLSTGASVLLVHGAVRPQDRRALRQVRPLVAALHPRDARLRGLRLQMLGALRRAIAARAGRPGELEARAMLADAAKIRAGLKRYSDAHPPIAAIAPD